MKNSPINSDIQDWGIQVQYIYALFRMKRGHGPFCTTRIGCRISLVCDPSLRIFVKMMDLIQNTRLFRSEISLSATRQRTQPSLLIIFCIKDDN